jgi:hypothetical protein
VAHGPRRLTALSIATAVVAALVVAGSGGAALAAPVVSASAASPGFQPVQQMPSLPAVPAGDIQWTIADPAFEYNPTTGERGAPFTPLLDADGQPRTRVLTGTDQGSGYRIEVPVSGWNGDVVLWEHGFRGTGTTVWVSNPSFDLREHYIDNGYAWAASSYSANRYDIEAGVTSTERLAELFDELVGEADRRYLQGVSMGGHIIGALVERQRIAWDGAAPMCGVMGDLAQFDIRLDYNLVAQALAEVDAFPFATSAEYVEAIAEIKAALNLPTSSAGPNPDLNERGRVFRDVVIDITGGPRPGGEAAFTHWEGMTFNLGRFGDDPTGTLGELVPGFVAQNADTLYPTKFTFPDGTTLNSRVERVAAAPGTRADDGPITPVNGTFRVPVLSVHTLGDLFVPFEHQRIYAAAAKRQGTGGLLVQRTVRSLGHCEFSPREAAQTFDDLVSWVESREASGPEERPAGEDVLNRNAVASPDFGCRFTTPNTGGTRDRFAQCAGLTPSPSPSPSPSPAPGDCRVLDIAANTGTITVGQRGSVTVSGASAGAGVELWAYSNRAGQTQRPPYFRARQSAANAAGEVTFGDLLPPTNTRLFGLQSGCDRAQFGGEGRDGRTAVINVRTAVGLSAFRDGVRDYRFEGRLLPGNQASLVTLYRVDPRTGADILTAQVVSDPSTGVWRIRRQFTGSGRFDFVARTGQTLVNAPGASNVRPTVIF